MSSREKDLALKFTAATFVAVGGTFLLSDIASAQEAPEPVDGATPPTDAPPAEATTPAPSLPNLNTESPSLSELVASMRPPVIATHTIGELGPDTVVTAPVPVASLTPVAPADEATAVGVASTETRTASSTYQVLGQAEQAPMDRANVNTDATGSQAESGLVGVSIAPSIEVSSVRPESPTTPATPATNVSGVLVTSMASLPETSQPAPTIGDRLSAGLDAAAGFVYEMATGEQPAAQSTGSVQAAASGETSPAAARVDSAPISIHDQAGATTGLPNLNVFGNAPVTVMPDGTIMINQGNTTSTTTSTTSESASVPDVSVVTGTTTEATPSTATAETSPNTTVSSIGPDTQRVALADAIVDDHNNGRPTAVDNLVSHIRESAPQARPEGFVFVPQPSMIDGGTRTEFQVSTGTARHEQRGSAELVAVTMAVTNYADRLMAGTNFTVEIGDLDSPPHIEHDFDSPAVDIRSRSADVTGALDGPVFVPNSPNFDPAKELEIIKFLRGLTINGQPAVRYVIGGSKAVEDLVVGLGDGMVRDNDKLYYIYKPDHSEHLHIAINPAVLGIMVDSGGLAGCEDACEPAPDYSTSEAVAAANQKWVDASTTLAGLRSPMAAPDAEATPATAALMTAAPANPVSELSTSGIDVVVNSGTEGVALPGGFTVAQILQAPNISGSDGNGPMAQLVADMAKLSLTQPQVAGTVEIPDLSRPDSATTTPASPNVAAAAPATAEVAGNNQFGIPDAAFALLSPEAQSYQIVDPATSVARSMQSPMNQRGLSYEEAYGPSIGANSAYVMERFAGHSPMEALLFTAIGGRETYWRPASSGDFKPDGNGLVAYSYGMHAIRHLDDNPIRDPQTNLNPWTNTVNSRQMYLESGLKPWLATPITEVTEEAVFQAIRMPTRQFSPEKRQAFDENMRGVAREAVAAYYQMEGAVSAALSGVSV